MLWIWSCAHAGLGSSVAELHHFYAAPVPGKNFDRAPTPATIRLQYIANHLSKNSYIYRNYGLGLFFLQILFMIEIAMNVNRKINELLRGGTFLIIHSC
jgi:hypothetical protein